MLPGSLERLDGFRLAIRAALLDMAVDERAEPSRRTRLAEAEIRETIDEGFGRGNEPCTGFRWDDA
ncbi:MAG: hypothetical protein RBS39_13755 [Phycisphaerales bacterium]|nr:hypothetical protein [Phycisphaerales bacterium]